MSLDMMKSAGTIPTQPPRVSHQGLVVHRERKWKRVRSTTSSGLDASSDNGSTQRCGPAALASGATDYLFDGMVSWAYDNPYGRGPAGTALRGRIVTVTDQQFAPWAHRAVLYGLSSAVSIPFEMRGQWAVLTIYARDAGAFDERNLAVLASLGRNLERALSSLRRRQELDPALESTVTALVTLGEFRDPYTFEVAV